MCKHQETSCVCGICDAEYVRKNERLLMVNRQIDESIFYDDPSSEFEALWEEREALKKELYIS